MERLLGDIITLYGTCALFSVCMQVAINLIMFYDGAFIGTFRQASVGKGSELQTLHHENGSFLTFFLGGGRVAKYRSNVCIYSTIGLCRAQNAPKHA